MVIVMQWEGVYAKIRESENEFEDIALQLRGCSITNFKQRWLISNADAGKRCEGGLLKNTAR